MAEMNEKFEHAAARSNQLEQMINDERDERLRQTDEQLRPVKAKLKGTLLPKFSHS